MTVTIIPPGAETDEQYHRSGAWGSTLINTVLRSPALAHHIRTGLWRPPETPAFRFGRLFHHRMDPTFAFEKQYRVGPDVDKRNKAWKEAEAAAIADQVILITADELQQAEAMRDSVLANPVAASLLTDAIHEIGFRMTAPQGNFQLQCRADIYHTGSHIADLKTTVDVDDFASSVANYGYHRQAALYSRIISPACGIKPLPFTFIVVEKTAPLYRCRVFDLDDDYLVMGHRDLDIALNAISRRTENNDWEDHRTAELLSPPAWLQNKQQFSLAA